MPASPVIDYQTFALPNLRAQGPTRWLQEHPCRGRRVREGRRLVVRQYEAGRLVASWLHGQPAEC